MAAHDETFFVVNQIRIDAEFGLVLQASEEVHISPVPHHLDRIFVGLNRSGGGDGQIHSLAVGLPHHRFHKILLFGADKAGIIMKLPGHLQASSRTLGREDSRGAEDLGQLEHHAADRSQPDYA